jgi:hypothetical protein
MNAASRHSARNPLRERATRLLAPWVGAFVLLLVVSGPGLVGASNGHDRVIDNLVWQELLPAMTTLRDGEFVARFDQVVRELVVARRNVASRDRMSIVDADRLEVDREFNRWNDEFARLSLEMTVAISHVATCGFRWYHGAGTKARRELGRTLQARAQRLQDLWQATVREAQRSITIVEYPAPVLRAAWRNELGALLRLIDRLEHTYKPR